MSTQDKPKYAKWYKTGIYCHESEQDCDNCWFYKEFKARDGQGCHQPKANALLLSLGIKPDGKK